MLDPREHFSVARAAVFESMDTNAENLRAKAAEALIGKRRAERVSLMMEKMGVSRAAAMEMVAIYDNQSNEQFERGLDATVKVVRSPRLQTATTTSPEASDLAKVIASYFADPDEDPYDRFVRPRCPR
jgi:hypothetical protein